MTQTQHSLIARMGHDIGDFCDRLIDRANAFGTGLGGPEGPEPDKPSPRSARHPISQVSSVGDCRHHGVRPDGVWGSRAMSGRSPQAGRACGPSDLSQSSLSQPEALVPNAYGEPVSTVAELDTLNSDEVVEGYLDGLRNEPEPTGNRSRAYWHGWRNGMSDAGRREIDAAQRQLAHEAVKQSREQAERTGA